MLICSKHKGCIEALLINQDRDESLSSAPVDCVAVGYDGFAGEAHSGLTRPSCSRVKHQYRRGTEIRNTRQITILSREELGLIAQAMGISSVEPEWIGANIVVSGIADLTLLPPSTRRHRAP